MNTTQQMNEVFNFTKERNFTQISNDLLLDKGLSFGARGLLGMMLSRPKNWQFFKGELASNTTESEYAVTKLLKELSDKKYIYKFQVGVKGEVRKFKWLWFINEIPFTDEQIEYINKNFRNHDTIKSTTSCIHDNRKSEVYSNTDSLSNTNLKENNNTTADSHLTDEQKKFKEQLQTFKSELSMMIRERNWKATPEDLLKISGGDFNIIKRQIKNFGDKGLRYVISAIKNKYDDPVIKPSEKEKEVKVLSDTTFNRLYSAYRDYGFVNFGSESQKKQFIKTCELKGVEYSE